MLIVKIIYWISFSSVDTTFIEYITCVILKLKNDENL